MKLYIIRYGTEEGEFECFGDRTKAVDYAEWCSLALFSIEVDEGKLQREMISEEDLMAMTESREKKVIG